MRRISRITCAALVGAIAISIIQPGQITVPASASESLSILSGSLNVYTNGTDVSISWDLGQDAKTSLTVDGQELAHGAGVGHLYLDDIALKVDSLDVTLTAARDLDTLAEQAVSKKYDISTESARQKYEQISVSHIPFLIDRGQSSGDSALAAAALPSISILRYQTFIPSEYVDQNDAAEKLACTPDILKTFSFNGNNRGFDALSGSFKTRMDTWIYWDQGGAILSNTFVGATSLFEKVGTTYVLQSTRRASDASMVVQTSFQSSSSVRFKMKQNVINPFCSDFGQGIEFDFDVQIWRTGKYALNGWAIRVPSHEAYLKESDSPAWYPILKSGFDTFACLTPFFIDAVPGCKNSYDLQSQKG
jgi:uncharacterized protein YaiE (UPF0345 family)